MSGPASAESEQYKQEKRDGRGISMPGDVTGLPQGEALSL